MGLSEVVEHDAFTGAGGAGSRGQVAIRQDNSHTTHSVAGGAVDSSGHGGLLRTMG